MGKAQIILGRHILVLVYLFAGWDPNSLVWIDSQWAKGHTHFGQAVDMIYDSCFSSFNQGQIFKRAVSEMLTDS